MTSQQMKDWRTRMGFTNRADAAKAIGCSLRSIYNYESDTPIPKYIALACAAVEKGIVDALDNVSISDNSISGAGQ